jgi:predicted dehydrogenase
VPRTEPLDRPVRWALLGGARIAQASFLPGLAAAGGGEVYAVGGRDRSRVRRWADEQGIARAVTPPADLLDDPAVDAVYVPLPNALHAEWTIAALEAGKAVLCEKPLCRDLRETERVLDVARRTGGLLWEAFVFPFSPQTTLLRRLLAEGAVGAPRAVHAEFHFTLDDVTDIRFDPALAGGALNDVGCYPVRLARLLFDAEPVYGSATQYCAESGVDTQTAGVLTFPGERQLLFSCGFDRPYNAWARVVGTDGELRVTDAYHPTSAGSVEHWRGGSLAARYAGPPLPSFAYALRHVHDVLRTGATPQHLAVDDAAGNARALDMVRAAAGL